MSTSTGVEPKPKREAMVLGREGGGKEWKEGRRDDYDISISSPAVSPSDRFRLGDGIYGRGRRGCFWGFMLKDRDTSLFMPSFSSE